MGTRAAAEVATAAAAAQPAESTVRCCRRAARRVNALTLPIAAAPAWLIAVLICVGANTISNLGLNFQKLAYVARIVVFQAACLTLSPSFRRASHERKKRKPLEKMRYRSIWIIGFMGIVGGAIGDFAALGFGAQSIVAPLGATTLVANVIFAPCMLGEEISRSDLMATAAIVFGCVISVVFAQHKDCLLDTQQLFDLYTTERFAYYASLIVSTIMLFLVAIRHMEITEVRKPLYYSTKYFKFHRFSYAALSGIVGAQSVLFAKTTVELFMDWFHCGDFPLAKPETYLVLLAMGTSVTLQIYWLNCGLARWDALYNVPVFQSFWIMVSVCGGGVFYGEFEGFDTLHALLFPVGVLIAVAGVIYLSQRDADEVKRRESIDMTSDGHLVRSTAKSFVDESGDSGSGDEGAVGLLAAAAVADSQAVSESGTSVGDDVDASSPIPVRRRTRRGNSDGRPPRSTQKSHNRLAFLALDPLSMTIHSGRMYTPAAFDEDRDVGGEAVGTNHPLLDAAESVLALPQRLRRGSLPEAISGLFTGGTAPDHERREDSDVAMRDDRANSGTALSGGTGSGASGGTFDHIPISRERSATMPDSSLHK